MLQPCMEVIVESRVIGTTRFYQHVVDPRAGSKLLDERVWSSLGTPLGTFPEGHSRGTTRFASAQAHIAVLVLLGENDATCFTEAGTYRLEAWSRFNEYLAQWVTRAGLNALSTDGYP